MKIVTFLIIFLSSFNCFAVNDVNAKSWQAMSKLDKKVFRTKKEKLALFAACGVQYTSRLISHENMKSCKRLRYDRAKITNRELYNLFLDNIHREHVVPVAVALVNSQVGYGAFTQMHLFKNQFVGEFTGEVKKIKDCVPSSVYRVGHSLEDYTIDASNCGNETRFLNDGREKANCDIITIKGLDKQLHEIVIASRDVQAGEQLTVHYGEDFWHSPRQGEFQDLTAKK